MLRLADIAVYGLDDTLQLVVEVRSTPGASLESVIYARQNLLAQELIPRSPYFLLALPDSFYLWKDNRLSADDRPPDYVIDAAEALVPYLAGTTLSLPAISKYGLELLVLAWLEDVVRRARSGDASVLKHAWLVESDLHQAISKGSVAAGVGV